MINQCTHQLSVLPILIYQNQLLMPETAIKQYYSYDLSYVCPLNRNSMHSPAVVALIKARLEKKLQTVNQEEVSKIHLELAQLADDSAGNGWVEIRPVEKLLRYHTPGTIGFDRRSSFEFKTLELYNEYIEIDLRAIEEPTFVSSSGVPLTERQRLLLASGLLTGTQVCDLIFPELSNNFPPYSAIPLTSFGILQPLNNVKGD